MIRSIYLLFVLVCASILCYSQTFTPVNATFLAKGIADWNDGQVVVYGSGLMFVDSNGEILDQVRILEGLSNVDFIDAQLDSSGNLWIISHSELAVINPQKQATSVLSCEEYDCGSFREIRIGRNDEVYVLSQKQVIQIDANRDHSIALAPKDQNTRYRHMTIAPNGDLWVLGSQEMLLKRSNGEEQEYPFTNRFNSQKLVATSDGKVLLVDYKNIYEFKDGTFDYFLKGHLLVRGLKIYTAVFNSSNDYWIYANEGNAFHNSNGTWTNYTPPFGLKTGNFGEGMHLAKNGDVWMSLKKQILLRFDGSKWKRIESTEQAPVPQLGNAELLGGKKLIVKRADLKNYATLDASGLKHLPGIPGEGVNDIKMHEGVIYYGTKQGIYRVESGQDRKVVDAPNLSKFGVTDKGFIYTDKNFLYEVVNSVSTKLANNEHFMGWENKIYPEIAQLDNGKLAAFSNKRAGLISFYEDGQWRKVIDADGKKIHKITDIIFVNDETFILNEQGSLLSYKDGKLVYLYEAPYQERPGYINLLACPDKSLWIKSSQNDLAVWKDNIYQALEFPIKKSGNTIRAIVPQDDPNVYHIYTGNEIIECNLER